MLLTTATIFAPGTRLAIQARLAFQGLPTLMHGTAEVLGFRELVPNLLYETRVRFVDLDRRALQTIADFCAENAGQWAATG